MLGEDDDDEEASRPSPSARSRRSRWRGARPSSFAGPAMNFVFAFLVYAVLFGAVGAEVPSNEPRVGGVARGHRRRSRPASRPATASSRSTARRSPRWEQLSKTVRGSEGRSRSTLDGRARRRAESPLAVTPRAARRHDAVRRGRRASVVPDRHRGVARAGSASGRSQAVGMAGAADLDRVVRGREGPRPHGPGARAAARARRADRDRAAPRASRRGPGSRYFLIDAGVPLDQPRRAEPAADPRARRRASRASSRSRALLRPAAPAAASRDRAAGRAAPAAQR